MDVATYLDFIAKIKGVPHKERTARIGDAVDKARVGDVRRTLIGRLSKGFRQRVGLAAAILHNPEVLILDEPTAGLDPKQIIETRELIKGLEGDHTIVLSTHILPEVSMTCRRVLIINKGKVVAEGTPDSLTHRLRGAALVQVEVRGEREAAVELARSIPGVKDVQARSGEAGATLLEIEADAARDVREELARAIVQKGLGLLSLRRAGLSLEDIFLHLTTTDADAPSEKAEVPA
jgi:ABC-2 type transport system ATP-binding protein